jgi:hypothetical protein
MDTRIAVEAIIDHTCTKLRAHAMSDTIKEMKADACDCSDDGEKKSMMALIPAADVAPSEVSLASRMCLFNVMSLDSGISHFTIVLITSISRKRVLQNWERSAKGSVLQLMVSMNRYGVDKTKNCLLGS